VLSTAVRFNVAIALLNLTIPGACFVGLGVQHTYGPDVVGMCARKAGTGLPFPSLSNKRGKGSTLVPD